MPSDRFWSRFSMSMPAGMLRSWGKLNVPVYRATRGRLMGHVNRAPVLLLTTTGRKSGQQRTTPLATKPDGEGWYVVGSNFGREKHPAWTANLMANPDAEVSFNGKSTPVHAHLLTTEEKQEVWPRLVQFWPNYDVYVERSGRDLRVFRLDPK